MDEEEAEKDEEDAREVGEEADDEEEEGTPITGRRGGWISPDEGGGGRWNDLLPAVNATTPNS